MENSSASAADKKRNKLGYHRTSVACVHCRRRKIRCLLSSDDTQGRCENCIRLKKECHFFPVDQQPPVNKRTRAGSKPETPSTETSITSSPPLGSGSITDQKDSYFQYSPLPGQEISPFDTGAFPGAPISTFSPDSMGPHDYVAVASLDQPGLWDESPYFNPQMPGVIAKPQIASPTGASWNQGTSVTSLSSTTPISVSPNTPAALSRSLHGNNAFDVSHDASAWNIQPTTRSMTVTSTAGPPQYSNQFHPPVAPDFKRRMTVPAELYAQRPVNGPIPGLQSASIPTSFADQPSPVGYPAWNTYSGSSVLAPNPNHPMPDTNSDMGGWYAADPLSQG